MSEPRYSAEQLEVAALAALDLVPAGETGRPRTELVAKFREAAALMAECAPQVAPPPTLKDRLMNRLADYESLKPLVDVRPYDGTWTSTGSPGVDVKTLFQDPQSGRTTMLVRMQPGARLPAHHHHDDEQCLVLSGDVRWRDIAYEQGDFVVMRSESHHPEVHSVNGNLLLIISGRNEYVHA
jgi:anti-sigma factor ChrR (cupin superfamily)